MRWTGANAGCEGEKPMADIEIDQGAGDIRAARSKARTADHVQRAQTMLLVAGMAAGGIVAVAAAMITTLL